MKRITLLVVALCMLSSGTAGTITHSVSFPSSGLHMWQDTISGEQYTQLSIDGLNTFSTPGVPKLPVKYVRLVVPYNATNITVNCTYANSQIRSFPSTMIPVSKPMTTNESISSEPLLTPNLAIYSSNTLYPANLVDVVSDGYFKGENHIITLELHPVQCNLVTKQLFYYSDMTTTVNYDTIQNNTNLLLRNNVYAREKDQKELAWFVDNPNQIHSFAPQTLGPSMSSGDNSYDNLTSYEYNIITTRALEPAFKRLIALKRQKGYSAGTICIEDIMQNPLVSGGDVNRDSLGNVVSVFADSAGVIRAYLKKIYNGEARFILMGGKGVPFRCGKALDYSHIVPTDFYFSELNTSWNFGTDIKTGKTIINQSSNVDPNAEYYIGRLLGSSCYDINNYTSKLYRYELNPGNGDFSYLKRALYFEYRDMHKYHEVDSVSAIANSVFSGNNEYLIDTGDEANMVKGSEVINLIKAKKFGLVDLHSHGSPSSIKLFNKVGHSHRYVLKAYEDVPLPPGAYYDDSGCGLNNLNNKFYPSILYSISCTTMPFDTYTDYSFNPPYTYQINRNLGDSFTSGKDYGGVAFLSNTREGYYGNVSDYSTGLECDFFKFITAGCTNIGIAEALSKSKFNSNNKKTYFEMVHNLVGDPEFQMWTDIPTYYQNISISRTNNSITINGINDSESKIVYCDATSQQTMISQLGSVTFQNVSPNGSIMVYKNNKIPYIADMNIQNDIISDSRYVVASNVYVGADIDSNRSFGNVIITSGTEYEIEAKGDVTIHNGFTVEKGASFGVYPFAF